LKLGPIGGYTITVGGYSTPLKEHRENTTNNRPTAFESKLTQVLKNPDITDL